MVISDRYNENPTPPDIDSASGGHKTKKDLRFSARPLDRLSAQIFDNLIVLLPVFIVLSAPFKSRFYHGMLLENQDEIFICALANVLVAISVFVIYHTFAITFFGTTIGKRLFQLQVVDVWTGGQVSFYRAFGRAVVSIFSILFLGFGFLTLFSNERRRSVADLWFECEVTSLVPTLTSVPNRSERVLVRFVCGLLAGIFCLGLFATIYGVFSRPEGSSELSSWLSDRQSRCEAVEDAVASWPKKENAEALDKPDRLQVGLSLYAAGLVDRSCLRTELDIEASYGKSLGPEYYLAQSFVHSDEPEISDSYLTHVCEQDANSSACELSHVVSAWGDSNWDELSLAITKMKSPDIASSVWAIRHYMKRGEPELAFQWIQKISPNKALGNFLEVQRTKALWLMDRTSEAKSLALSNLETLPDDLQRDLASWMCVQETSVDCHSEKSASCAWLKTQEVGSIEEEDPAYAVALLKTKECSSEGNVNYLDLANMSESAAWQNLIRGVSKIRANEKLAGKKLFQEVIADEDAPSSVRAEAYRRLFKISDDKSLAEFDIDDLPQGMWREIRPQFAKETSFRHLDPVANHAKPSSSRMPASEDEE
jgi:uncharacterized RDD family membrane protein YckC